MDNDTNNHVEKCRCQVLEASFVEIKRFLGFYNINKTPFFFYRRRKEIVQRASTQPILNIVQCSKPTTIKNSLD